MKLKAMTVGLLGTLVLRDYVVFTHYVEGLHTMLQGGDVHHGTKKQGEKKGHGH